jgi:hypothetical protein
MDSLQFHSDNKVRTSDTLDVVFFGLRRCYTYNPETGKHDIPGDLIPPHVTLMINDWEQVSLEKEKVKLLVDQLNKFLSI